MFILNLPLSIDINKKLKQQTKIVYGDSYSKCKL